MHIVVLNKDITEDETCMLGDACTEDNEPQKRALQTTGMRIALLM